MRIQFFYAAPGDNNGQAPLDPIAEAEKIKAAANQSITNIVDNAFTPEILPPGNVEIPLGDNGNRPPPQSTTPGNIPYNPGTPNDIFKQLDELDRDIDSAQLEGASDASVRSFNGLKARYKNKNTGIRNQVNSLLTQVTALTSQLEGLDKLKDKATKYEEVIPTVTQLEDEVATLRKENESLSYYRRKYDLENDPAIKREYVDPMQDLKHKSMDILQNNGLDENFWNELINSDSEYRMNSLIDNHKISGLNAQSLKQYVSYYQQLDSEYAQVSAPENIDAAIDTARGTRLQLAQKVGESVFNATQAKFGEWVDELKESDFNKEHNHFIFDTVAKQGKTNFDNLKKALPKDFADKNALHQIAKAALMAAAYPAQKTMLEHALNIISDLKKEMLASGGPGMRQTRENIPRGSNTGSVEEIKKEAAKSIKDIAAETFSGRLG